MPFAVSSDENYSPTNTKPSIASIQTSSGSLNASLPGITQRYSSHIPTFSRCSPSYSTVPGTPGFMSSATESGPWSAPGLGNYPNTDGQISNYVTMQVSSRGRNAGALTPFSAASSLAARKYTDFSYLIGCKLRNNIGLDNYTEGVIVRE